MVFNAFRTARNRAVFCVAAAMSVGALMSPPPARAAETAAQLLDRIRNAHSELKDMNAAMSVQHENNTALAKISGDFAQFVKYGFRDFKYTWKNPDKVRIESTATLFHFLHGISIRNGGQKNFYVPSLHVHRTA